MKTIQAIQALKTQFITAESNYKKPIAYQIENSNIKTLTWKAKWKRYAYNLKMKLIKNSIILA